MSCQQKILMLVFRRHMMELQIWKEKEHWKKICSYVSPALAQSIQVVSHQLCNLCKVFILFQHAIHRIVAYRGIEFLPQTVVFQGTSGCCTWITLTTFIVNLELGSQVHSSFPRFLLTLVQSTLNLLTSSSQSLPNGILHSC